MELSDLLFNIDDMRPPEYIRAKTQLLNDDILENTNLKQSNISSRQLQKLGSVLRCLDKFLNDVQQNNSALHLACCVNG